MANTQLILQGDLEAANPLDRNSHGLFITLDDDRVKQLHQLEDLIQKKFLTRDLGRGRSGGPRIGRMRITVEQLEVE